MEKRTGANVNAYLILRQSDRVLLQLRKNTGYCDGMWGFVAGHVEDGEPATEAMIREAREEIGLFLIPSQIQVAHIMHRKTNRLNVDIFFNCPVWQGSLLNLEPDKCEKIEFFTLNSLPANMIQYHKIAFEYDHFYSEHGWDE